MGTKESLTPANHEGEGEQTPTAVLDGTYRDQADASKGRLSRLSKSTIAAITVAIAAIGSGVGLVLSAGGEKVVHGTEVIYPKPQIIDSDRFFYPAYRPHPITEHTTKTVPTTNGLEHGLGWGLIGAGAGLATLALWGAGILINRHMQKKNANLN